MTRPLVPLAHLRLVVRLFGRRALFRPRFQHRLGLGEPNQSCLAQGDLVADHQTIREFAVVGLLPQGKQLVDLGLELLLDCQQTLVADRLAFGGIGVDFTAIKTDPAQLQDARQSSQQENLDEQALELRQKRLAEGGQGVVIGMEVARDEAEGHGFGRGALDLARTEHARGVAVEEQPQQNLRRVGLPTSPGVPSIHGLQIELGDGIHNEARQVVGWQAVPQPYRQIEGCLVVDCLKCSFHTPNLSQSARLRITFSPTGC